MATGGIPMPAGFLLRKPIEVRRDGYQATHTPFVISYDGRDVYAAFTDAAVAAYFVSALRLDTQYEPVPLRETRPADLKDAEYALVLRRKSEIDALLRGWIVPSSFTRNLLKVRVDVHAHLRRDQESPGMSMGAVVAMFRWPRLPVIVTGPRGLAAALDRKKLIAVLGAQTPTDSKFEVKVIDTTGREFWYDTTQRILAPGFAAKVWTKRQLVQLYNDNSGAALAPYQPGSLPNRRLGRVVQEITNLLIGGKANRKRPLKHDKSTFGQEGQGAG